METMLIMGGGITAFMFALLFLDKFGAKFFQRGLIQTA